MQAVFQSLIDLDTSVFLALHQMLRSQFCDSFMMLFSARFVWVPMYAAIAVAIFGRYRWREALLLVLAVAMAITVCDQLCATIIRPVFERLRPSNPANPLSDLVTIVMGYRGGAYGFPSCHAANSFGLATIVSLIIRRKRFGWWMFAWAVFNSYSRIYLGVHYPGDLLAGAVIGCLVGWIAYQAAILAMAMRGNNPLPGSQTGREVRMLGCDYTLRPCDLPIAVGLLTVAAIAAYAYL